MQPCCNIYIYHDAVDCITSYFHRPQDKGSQEEKNSFNFSHSSNPSSSIDDSGSAKAPLFTMTAPE